MNEKKIMRKAARTAEIVAQLPLATKNGLKVLRTVVQACASSCCATKAEEELFKRGFAFTSKKREVEFMTWSDGFWASSPKA